MITLTQYVNGKPFQSFHFATITAAMAYAQEYSITRFDIEDTRGRYT